MNTRELARAIEAETGVKAYITLRAIAAMPGIIRAQTKKGSKVTVGKLGTFGIKRLKAGKFKNMKTKQIEEVPSRLQIAFRAAGKFKKV